MSVIVKLFANFREAMGKGSVEVEDVKNVGELIEKLILLKGKLAQEFYYPETKEFVKSIQIMVNGKRVKIPEDLEKPLKSGDEVAIFPPVAGGAAL